MNMQDWTPSGKVSAAGIAGTVTFLGILALNQYVPFFHNNAIDGPLGSGLPFVAAMIAAYFTQPSDSDVAKVEFKQAGE